MEKIMTINNGKYADFIIFGTGDKWMGDGGLINWYTLLGLKKVFSKNSIDILKEVFLNNEIGIKPSFYYEYEDMAYNCMNGWSKGERYIINKKNIDEIITELTEIYIRLYKECEKNEKSTVLKTFKTIMTSLNIINCTLNQLGCNDSLSIIKYIDMLPLSEVAKKALYEKSYKQLEQYNKDNNNHIKVNTRYNGIESKDIENIKKLDEKYVYKRDNNLLKPYKNYGILTYEQYKEIFKHEDLVI